MSVSRSASLRRVRSWSGELTFSIIKIELYALKIIAFPKLKIAEVEWLIYSIVSSKHEIKSFPKVLRMMKVKYYSYQFQRALNVKMRVHYVGLNIIISLFF